LRANHPKRIRTREDCWFATAYLVPPIAKEAPVHLVLRFALNLLLRLALVTVLATLILLPAQAEDLSASEIQIDTRLLCNTEHKAFRFVRLYAGDVEAALRIVNAEESNPTACGMVPVLYYVGPRLGSAKSRAATFNIVKIVVVGVVTSDGVQTVPPTQYFSAFEVDEREA
jgi:hypothetical protein